MDWTDEVIDIVSSSERIAKHAHVPMQSGSDRVLRLMHRKYRPWHYAEKIRKLRAAMPTAAIGADVMVGFPGETDADFEETRALIAELPFTYLHVFTYSARPGTPAAAMPNQVPVPVRASATGSSANWPRKRNSLSSGLLYRKGPLHHHTDPFRRPAYRDTHRQLPEALRFGPQQANQIRPAIVESVSAEGMFGTLLRSMSRR